MKLFQRLLVLLLLAALGAVAWHALASDPGRVHILWRGWSVESTLVVAVLALLALWLALRLVWWAVLMPARLWRRSVRRRARARLGAALRAAQEGRPAQAQRLFERAASDADLRTPALLEAARWADARGDSARHDALLASIDDTDAVALARAQRAFAAGDAATALALLPADTRRCPPAALLLRARALSALQRAGDALALLPALRKTDVLPGPDFDAFETALGAAALAQAPDAEALADRWEALTRALRRAPDVVAAYALRAVALGLERQALAALRNAAGGSWSDALGPAFAALPASLGPARIAPAEDWLKDLPDNPALLLALGTLCRDDGLWGKAEGYLRAAIEHGAGAPAWEALADVFDALHAPDRARLALRNALASVRGDAVRALPAARGTPALAAPGEPVEERSPMGVPRLASSTPPESSPWPDA